MVGRGVPALSSGAEPIADARDRVAEVLADHGHEAGQYHVLGPDPWQLVWTTSRSGFIAFLEGRRCLLAWRSPVAAEPDHPELLDRLLHHSRQVGKALLAVLVNDSVRSVGSELGLLPIWAGSEAVIHLPNWSTRGGRGQKVRWARSHAVKLGLTWREAFPVDQPDDRAGIERVEQHWKAERAERRTDSFQRTSFEELAGIRRYFVAEGADGVLAFAACTPVNRRGWYLQDVVRLPDAPRGALEGAMALALDTFRDEGFDFASNGPLPFWRPDHHGPNEHDLGWVGQRTIEFFDRQYRFRGISQFRSKFAADEVRPLYILRSRRLVTPGVAASLRTLLTERIS